AASSGVKTAARALRTMLDDHGLCVAWVDGSALPHRAASAKAEGNMYHVITVYAVDEDAGTATIGDLADEPIIVPLDALAEARGRIKKDKNRLLALRAPAALAPLADLVREGLRACHAGLLGEGAPKQARSNFSL